MVGLENGAVACGPRGESDGTYGADIRGAPATEAAAPAVETIAGPWLASGEGRPAEALDPLLKAVDPPLLNEPFPDQSSPGVRGSQGSWSPAPAGAGSDVDDLLWPGSEASLATVEPAPYSGGAVFTPTAGLTSGTEPVLSGLPSASQSSGSERFSTPSSSEPFPVSRLSPGCGLCSPDVLPLSAGTLVRRPNVPVRCIFRLTASP